MPDSYTENITVLMNEFKIAMIDCITNFASPLDANTLENIYHINDPFYTNYIIDIANMQIEQFTDIEKYVRTARIYKLQGKFYIEELAFKIPLSEIAPELIIKELKCLYNVGIGVILTQANTSILDCNGTIRWTKFYPISVTTIEKLKEYYENQLFKVYGERIEFDLEQSL